MAKLTPQPDDHIVPLLMNGLQGRMLHLPAAKASKRELLIIYGWQTSLEQWWPLAVELQRYGNVTMPDLPGFGGMQSFYRIHERPSLDNMADYLAAFVKLRYRSKRLTIFGIAYGFTVVTRMLQRYPDLAKKVDVVISLGGLARYDDLSLSAPKRWFYRIGARVLATRLLAFWVRQVSLHPLSLSWWYARQQPRPDTNERIWLWRHNDIRTRLIAASSLMNLDNCRVALNLPLWHVAFRANHNLDHQRLNQHLHVIYSSVDEARSRLKTQSIGTIEYNQQANQLLPPKLRRALAQLTLNQRKNVR